MRNLVLMILAATLVGCAASYGPHGGRGGYREKQIEANFVRLTFTGNAATTQETVQTYWLYRAAELTLEKGFDGFEIASQVNFVGIPIESPYVRAQMIFLPMVMPKFPVLEADILLLKGPVPANPPKVFDARALKAELEVHVNSEKKCESGNVCPHFKRYLRPITASPQT